MVSALQAYAGTAKRAEDAMSLLPEAYLDTNVFDDEVTHAFRKGWLPVARASELENPGDYRVADVGGEALVVTRDRSGGINVLSRICRHRAMSVVEGSGNTKTLNCPYHIWRYDLDGSFLSAPAMNESSRFDPSKCDLPTHRHEEWNGWVFVNLSGDAEPLGPQLVPLSERLERYNPSEMVTIGCLEFESPWNWKVMVENFMESYHHIGAHRETLEATNPGLGTYCSDLEGPFAVLENPPVTEEEDAFVVACVFPSTMLFFTDGPMKTGGWYEMCDIEKDRFLLRIHLLLDKEMAKSEEIVKAVIDNVRPIHLEDIPFCAGVQKGLASKTYRPGPLSHLEKCNWRLHTHLSNCFNAAG